MLDSINYTIEYLGCCAIIVSYLLCAVEPAPQTETLNEDNLRPYPHVCIRIRLHPQTFWYGSDFRSHVSGENAHCNRKLLKTLSRGQLFKAGLVLILG